MRGRATKALDATAGYVTDPADLGVIAEVVSTAPDFAHEDEPPFSLDEIVSPIKWERDHDGLSRAVNKESTSNDSDASVDHGLCIAVLDRGFVYVGNVTTDDKFVTITNAQNIRKWGTAKGLGQLAIEGPQPDTKLDDANVVKTLVGELKHMIICKEASWR